MPHKAIELLLTRLRARRAIEEIDRGEIEIDRIVQLLLESSGRPSETEAIDDTARWEWSVEHGTQKSSLEHNAYVFAQPLLQGGSSLLFRKAVQNAIWTDPHVVEAVRKTRYYRKHPTRIDKIIESFARRKPIDLNQVEKFSNQAGVLRKYGTGMNRVLCAAQVIAENKVFAANPQLLLAPLRELCDEIKELRKPEQKVRFSIDVEHGPLAFAKVSHKREYKPSPTSIKIECSRAQH